MERKGSKKEQMMRMREKDRGLGNESGKKTKEEEIDLDILGRWGKKDGVCKARQSH